MVKKEARNPLTAKAAKRAERIEIARRAILAKEPDCSGGIYAKHVKV
jgi:hypothetical protein